MDGPQTLSYFGRFSGIAKFTNMITTGILSALGTVVIAIFGYAYNLGNRVTKLETRQEDLPTLLKAYFDPVNQRLERIESKMDAQETLKDA